MNTKHHRGPIKLLVVLCALLLSSFVGQTAFAKSGKALPNRCTLPAKVGNCMAYIPSYYFNQKTGKCQKFVYGGCGGNENRFISKKACMQVCGTTAKSKKPTSAKPGKTPTNICSLPKVQGPCRGLNIRYYFNSKLGKCQRFSYGGCQGNANNFRSMWACKSRCPGKKNPAAKPKARKGKLPKKCTLPPKTGPCKAAFRRFYYNASSGTCKRFVYGGCKGNANNFTTLKTCQNACAKSKKPTPRTTKPKKKLPSLCKLPKKQGPCEAIFPRFYFDAKSGKCKKFIYGGCQGNANNFTSLKACQMKCHVAKKK